MSAADDATQNSGENSGICDGQLSAPRLNAHQVKELFQQHLCNPEQLKQPDGCATGLTALDRFLFWKGLPKGAISLFYGPLGSGMTSLWIEAADRILKSGRWVAWIDHGAPLSPLALSHKGLPLERLVSFEIQPAATPTKKSDVKRRLWLLQELMSSALFDLIGCDLGTTHVQEHQLRKLQAQARQMQVALVFVSQNESWNGSIASVFSLILQFSQQQLLIRRALHRPTPHSFARSLNYARFTLHTGDRIGFGANSESTRPAVFRAQPHSLFETSRSSEHRKHATR